jgi:YVTN family beta-propeller protein
LACSPTENLVYCANREDGTVNVVRADGQVTDTIWVGAEPEALAWSERGNRLYVASRGSNAVSIIDCRTNMVRATLPVGDEPVALAWDNGQSRLYVANHASSEITVVLDTAVAAVAEIPTPTARSSTVFATTAVCLHGRSPASLFDETGSLVCRLQPGENDIRFLSPGVYFIGPSEPARIRPSKVLITH